MLWITKSIATYRMGRTPLTGGRAQSSLPRAAPRLLGHSRIGQRLDARTTSSLGNGQGRRSDLVTQQFKDAPDMIGQATGHRRRAWHPEASFLNRFTQFMIRPAIAVRPYSEI